MYLYSLYHHTCLPARVLGEGENALQFVRGQHGFGVVAVDPGVEAEGPALRLDPREHGVGRGRAVRGGVVG